MRNGCIETDSCCHAQTLGAVQTEYGKEDLDSQLGSQVDPKEREGAKLLGFCFTISMRDLVPAGTRVDKGCICLPVTLQTCLSAFHMLHDNMVVSCSYWVWCVPLYVSARQSLSLPFIVAEFMRTHPYHGASM